MSDKKPGVKYTAFFTLVSLLCAVLSISHAESGFCVYHFPDWVDRFSIDEYVFYAFTTGVSNSSFYDPDPSLLESEECRTAPVSLDQEIGEGSLIAPSMVNACESVCDELLNAVRSRISRASCTYDAAESREYACDYAQDRDIIRPPLPPSTGTGSTGSGAGGGPGDGDSAPGGPGSTTDGAGSTLPPILAFGPNNSTSLPCDSSGLGSSYSGGDNFCRGVCGDLVEQTLLRLRQGGPSPFYGAGGNLVALWSYAEAWSNCP